MYNGIGLTTARGSGTNGHVQRNLSFVRQGKKAVTKYKTEADLNKADAANNRQPNEEILEHERKRKIEIKCLEFEEILEDQNYTAEEIAAKVQSFREKLMGNDTKQGLPKDEFGRYAVRETHQVAAAQQEKNAMLRSAFGISEYFVEGSSFDADRKAKEELAKSAALQKELDAKRTLDAELNKQYKMVRTPSREREIEKTDTATKTDEKEKSHKKKSSKKESSKKKHRKPKNSSSDSSESDSDSDYKSKKTSKKSKKHASSDKSDKKKSKKHRESSDSSISSSSSSSSSSESSSSDSSSSSDPSSSSDSSSHTNSDHYKSKSRRSAKRKHSSDLDSDSSYKNRKLRHK